MADQEKRKQPENLRLRAAAPALTVNDLEASLSFYQDILGFWVADRIEEDGVLVAAMLHAGDVDLLIGQDDFAKGRDRLKGVGLRLYCITVQDIDELAETIKARGGTLDNEPTDQPWGTRDFAISDPDGFRLTFSSPWSG